MKETIQTLLNCCEYPAFISNAEKGAIAFVNRAARQKFNVSRDQVINMHLHDLFCNRQIVRQKVIWRRHKEQFEIKEEKLELGGKTYIHSIIKPVKSPKHVLDLLETQKEMSKLLVHLFHSPLNGVAGFTELLQTLDLTEKQAKYVTSIEEGLNEFKNILSNIHSLAEEVEVQLTTIDVQSFAIMLLDQYAPDEKKRIDLTIASNLIELNTDYVLLKSIITELLDNALEFSPKMNKSVKLHFTDNNIIRVTSYGDQIPESSTEKIFYPFFTNKIQGMGLGLSKCMYLAHEMGYQIILSQNSSIHGISFEIHLR